MSTSRSDLECVEALRSARLALLAAQRARREAAAHVARARALGATWADVGAALGVTRQTAHERFGGGARRLGRLSVDAETPAETEQVTLRLALRPISATLRLTLRPSAHDPAMHDTTTKTNRCRRHVPAAPLRVAVPSEPPPLTAGAAGVLLEILRAARPASQDPGAPPDAA